MTTREQDYLFDLNGYLVLEEALTEDQVQWLNAWVDRQPKDLEPGTWLGHVETHAYSGVDGLNYQNVIEGGRVFETLMDHPAWIGLVRRYIESDYNQVSICENLLNVRRQGGYIEMHSGGHVRAPIMTFRHHTGQWNVGQINVIMALTDIGPGDGATVIIPGSHKAHEIHPSLAESEVTTYNTNRTPPDASLGAVELHLRKGQALLFTDSVMHGGTERKNPGERRIIIYRYSPHHILPRHNYVPSEEFLARLTPERRALINAVPPRLRPGRVLKGPDAPARDLASVD